MEPFLCAESWAVLKKSVFFSFRHILFARFSKMVIFCYVFLSLQTSKKAVETSKYILIHLMIGPCWIVIWYAARGTNATTRPFH